MPDLSGLDQIIINAYQRGAYVEDDFGLEGYEGDVSIIDILNEFSNRIENIEIGDGRTRYVQQIEGHTTNIITITEHGGILPDDRYVKLSSRTGPIFQGAGAQKYIINRAVVPNQIILGTVPLGPLDFYLEFWA